MPAVLDTVKQNSLFLSLAVANTIAGTHCAYSRRDGQAELAWVAGDISTWYARPKNGHPSQY